MMPGYIGAPKRWIEGLYGGSYPPQVKGTPVRSLFFKRHLGRDHVTVPHVGFNAHGVARPLIIGADLLEGSLDTAGQPIAGASDGLFYPNLPVGQEPTLEAISMLLERASQLQLLTLLPADQHENPAYFDPNALTSTILSPDLSRLSPRERQLVKQRYQNWINQRLPLGIWREIFMDTDNPDSQGQLIGKEARNFVPHCTEYVVEYINPVRQMLQKQRQAIAQALQQGDPIPPAWVLPVAKDGLTVDLPDNHRGLGGNKFDTLLAAAFTGDYFQGDDHRHQKRALVFGACSEYSVRLAIEHLFDADINVIYLLTCTKGFDIFSSKLYEVHNLVERYGKKVFCTYDWIEELLGPQPKGWEQLQQQVMAYDQQQHQQWFQAYQQQLAQGQSSLGSKLILNAQDVIQAAQLK